MLFRLNYGLAEQGVRIRRLRKRSGVSLKEQLSSIKLTLHQKFGSLIFERSLNSHQVLPISTYGSLCLLVVTWSMTDYHDVTISVFVTSYFCSWLVQVVIDLSDVDLTKYILQRGGGQGGTQPPLPSPFHPTSLPLSPHFPPPLPPLSSPSNPTSLPLSDFSLPLIKFCSCSWT